MSSNNNIKQFRILIIEGAISITISAGYAIAYMAVVNGVDRITCTGIPMQFGVFGKWAYIIAFIVSVVLSGCGCCILGRAGDEDARSNPLLVCRGLLAKLNSIFMTVVWVYACIALANRDTCQSRGLVNLLWVTVLVPVCIVVLGCCCFCCMLIVIGTAQPASPSGFVADRSGQGQQHVELLELRRALQERSEAIRNA